MIYNVHYLHYYPDISLSCPEQFRIQMPLFMKFLYFSLIYCRESIAFIGNIHDEQSRALAIYAALHVNFSWFWHTQNHKKKCTYSTYYFLHNEP